jgi:CheY-like chemotaxis protein
MMTLEGVMPGTVCRVLVVEDEPLIRLSTSEMLREAGYEVTEAGNAIEALACDDAFGPFDLIFTDVRMPGEIDGVALADILSVRRPDTSILVTTGTPHLVPAGWQAAIVRKPYGLTELLNRISTVLKGG